MSDILVWKDAYRVGDALVDTQHQELFADCQRVDALAASGKLGSQQAMTQELVHLFEEFRNHFDEEMQHLRRVYHVVYREHERHHAEFLEKLQSILDESNQRVPDVRALIAVVGSWFVDHILDTDIPQFEELRQRGLFAPESWDGKDARSEPGPGSAIPWCGG
jgi:hemerythrin-like metal-binding protein